MTTQARPFVLADLEPGIRDQIYDHVFASDDIEVGGVLVGDIDATGKAEVHGMIPALEADGTRASVTFTHEAWQKIIEVQDRDFPDSPVIVGWYHSHPGFGIFLSEHDNFIQKNFFREPFQLAYVIDPQAGTEGIFGWRDGKIVLLDKRPTPRRRTTLRPTVVVSLDEIEAAEAPTLAGQPLEIVPDEEPEAAIPVAAAPASLPARRRRVRGVAAVGGVAIALAAVAAGLGMSNSGPSQTVSSSSSDGTPPAQSPSRLKETTTAEIVKARAAVRAARASHRAGQRSYDIAKAKAAAALAARIAAANAKHVTTKSGPSSPPPSAPGNAGTNSNGPSPNATTDAGHHQEPTQKSNPLVNKNRQN